MVKPSAKRLELWNTKNAKQRERHETFWRPSRPLVSFVVQILHYPAYTIVVSSSVNLWRWYTSWSISASIAEASAVGSALLAARIFPPGQQRSMADWMGEGFRAISRAGKASPE